MSNLNSQFSFKELYSVSLKTTYPIEINGIQIESGEIIAMFDKIQIANFNEIKDKVSATGGFDNRNLVNWEQTKMIQIQLIQGVFSKTQFGLMGNSKIIEIKEEKPITIQKRENLESNEENLITLSQIPVGKIFIYEKDTGKKIDYTIIDTQKINIGNPFKEVIVDYNYNYSNGGSCVMVGRRLIEGYLSLEGKTRIKDDESGTTKTGIIKIPKLKLMSDLSMSLGKAASPMVENLTIAAYPIGERGNKEVMNIYFLQDDIDTDM